MPEKLISVDEYMAKRGHAARGDRVVKASKAPSTWSKDSRSAEFVMSTQQEDRDGDIVYTAGIDTTEFEKNPVALLFHKSRDFPVGTWSDLRKELGGATPRLLGTCGFVPEGTTQEADVTAKMVAAGTIRACSIGFLPKTIAMRTLDNGEPTWSYEIRECELFECSIVPIPANPGALVKAADGDMALAKDLVEEVLDTWAKTPEGLLVPRADFEKTYEIVSRAPVTGTGGVLEALRKLLGAAPAEETKAAAEPEPEVVKTPAGPSPEEIAHQTALERHRASKVKAFLA